ncbi:C40 family peptidase [Nesterenkonia alba]|uniref:C40 family peptidase n=1 Tax=Nesterenkonia alba TaxID=515814 RepID=UPI0003B3C084|nr:C40 family peptidase [Nesterenkonia alba]
MTDTIATASRRERRAHRSNSLARAVVGNAGPAGRTAAVALAASGLVISSGVAANATETGEGREVTSIQVNTSELNVERTSRSNPVTVSSSREAEITFDRPAVSSEPATGSQSQSQPATEESTQQQSQQTTQQDSTQSQQTQQQPQSQQTSQQESTSQAASSEQSAPAGGNNSSVVSAAYAGIGAPYAWGGTSPAGFDCSGFVNWAYARAGQPLSARSTGQMLASLPHVSSPQPGDIIISNGRGHAEIYIGNGQVISATSSGVRMHAYNGSWNRVNAILRPGG